MTKAPGASIYMPPEALGDESRYDMTIDIFSLGVVAIFTLTQRFPHKVLAQVYQDQHDKVVVRSELERREEYMQQIYRQFHDDHPLVQMIKQCLGSFPKNRPSIHQVVQLLERARGEIDDAECHMDRLVLVQTVKEQNQQIESHELQILSKNQRIGTLQQEMQSKEQEFLLKVASVEKESTKVVQKKIQEIQSLKAENEWLRKQVSVSHIANMIVCL